MGRLRGNRKEARLSVSLDERDYAQLCALARQHDVSVAWMVRQAVHTMIRQQQDAITNPELPLPRGSSRQPRPTP
jgi:hypothetical protein